MVVVEDFPLKSFNHKYILMRVSSIPQHVCIMPTMSALCLLCLHTIYLLLYYAFQVHFSPYTSRWLDSISRLKCSRLHVETKQVDLTVILQHHFGKDLFIELHGHRSISFNRFV